MGIILTPNKEVVTKSKKVITLGGLLSTALHPGTLPILAVALSMAVAQADQIKDVKSATALKGLGAAVFGTLDTEYLDLPRNQDADYIRTYANRSGQNAASLVAAVDARLRAFNAGAEADVAILCAPPTDEIFIDNPVSGVAEWRPHTQYVPQRPQEVEAPDGHNLAIEAWDAAIGWTEDGLLEMTERAALRQVDGILTGLRRLHRRRFWRRFFGDFEQKVDKKSTATSPGAVGSGTGLNAWSVSTFPDGSALPNNYTHYLRSTSDASALIPAIKTGKNYLKKWLGEGTLEIKPTAAAVAILAGLAANPALGFQGFVGADSALVRRSPNDQAALIDPAIYVGVIDGDIAIRKPTDDVGGVYFGMFRSNGAFAEGNPIVMRYDPIRGQAAFAKARGGEDTYPLAEVIFLQWFGYNWNSRVNGVLYQVAAGGGAYQMPDIPQA